MRQSALGKLRKGFAAGMLAALPAAAAVRADSVRATPAARPAAREASLYRLRTAPLASFVWLPRFPHTGEQVSFVSTSADYTSPIRGFAWDLSDNGPFGSFLPGGPVITTTFSTPASHVIRLRVTARDGLSGAVSETVRMSAPPPGVMRPFPTVKIVGRDLRAGVRMKVLAVTAPRGALIAIACKGRGCPVRALRRRGTARRSHLLAIRFHRLERFLRAPLVLEVRVSARGEIGGFTRFQIRPGRVPVRADSCLDTAGRKPISCPSS